MTTTETDAMRAHGRQDFIKEEADNLAYTGNEPEYFISYEDIHSIIKNLRGIMYDPKRALKQP